MLRRTLGGRRPAARSEHGSHSASAVRGVGRHPPRGGANHPLGQRRRRGPDGGERMADLQRVDRSSTSSFPTELTIGGWLAGRPAVALRRDVALRAERPRLRRLRHSLRPFPAQAPADHAARGAARRRARRCAASSPTTICRSTTRRSGPRTSALIVAARRPRAVGPRASGSRCSSRRLRPSWATTKARG